MKIEPLLLLAGLWSCFAAFAAFAAGGNRATPLDWPHKGEVLEYRSCGCADACWVAEVRDRRTQAPKARLHCDCETLSYDRFLPTPEHVVLGRCDAINGSDDKAAAIGAKLEELRSTKAAPR